MADCLGVEWQKFAGNFPRCTLGMGEKGWWELDFEEGRDFFKEGSGVISFRGNDLSGFGGGGEDAFGAHATLGKEFAELLEEPSIFLEQTGDERFGDFAGFAIGLGGDGGAAGFASEERHFAEVIAGVNGGDNGFGGTDGDRDDGLATEDDEHGVAWLSLLDNDFPDPEAE